MRHAILHLAISLIMVVMLLNMTAPITSASAQTVDPYLPNEVLIKLLRASDLTSIAVKYSLDVNPIDQFGTRAIFRMRIADGANPPDRAEELAADPGVIYAEPNFIGQAPEAQQRVSWAKGDEGQGDEAQWAGIMIRLPEAHTITRGAGITVAVLDTGVDFAHPALAGRLVNGYDFVDLDASPAEVGNHEQNIAYGHGTHVAGLVASVAPKAKIMPLRVLDPDGVGSIWVLAEAMAYAVNPDGNSKTDDGADVINLSLSTERPTHLLVDIKQEVTCSKEDDDDDDRDDDDDDRDDDDCRARKDHKGVVVVASAGNNGSSTPEYPAAEGVPGSLAVGASTASDTLTSFSNYGPWVHVTAPGKNILSSVPNGEYALWSGTSMAAPLVAGQAALIRAANPSMDAAAVVERIMETSAQIEGQVSRRIDVASSLDIPLVPIDREYVCEGTLGPVSVNDILVLQGHSCTLVGTRVMGNVKVEAGATLRAIGVNVKGNIQAKNAALIRVTESTVGGSLQVEEGGSARLHESNINGSVQFVKNRGSLVISNNIIKGNLQCKENNGMPVGGDNLVRGNKEEQCSNL